MQRAGRIILDELKEHAPFTAFGTITAIVILALMFHLRVPSSISEAMFWILHPLHVLASAWATTATYRRHSGGGIVRLIVVGYIGSVGITTLSDSLIPYAGEILLDLPNRGLHVGAIEKWWLVNPLAGLGILLGALRPRTRLPHGAHVLLSTWASLFHVTMAAGETFSAMMLVLVATFLFLAVWLPCCTSDIVLPLLLGKPPEKH